MPYMNKPEHIQIINKLRKREKGERKSSKLFDFSIQGAFFRASKATSVPVR